MYDSNISQKNESIRSILDERGQNNLQPYPGMRGGSINGGGTPDLHGWGCNNYVKLYTNNAHTHTASKDESQRRGRKDPTSYLTHLTQLVIFPLGLMRWIYVTLKSTLPLRHHFRHHSTSIYHTYEAKDKKVIPTQGYVVIRSLKLSKYLNLGKKPQSEWILETKPGRVAGLFGFVWGMGAC